MYVCVGLKLSSTVYFVLTLLRQIKAANVLLIIETKDTLGFSSPQAPPSVQCPLRIPHARSKIDSLNNKPNL